LLCWLSQSLHAHKGSLVAFYIFSCGGFEFTEEFFCYFVWQLNGSHEENRRRLLTQPMSLILVRKLVLSLGFRGSHPLNWTVFARAGWFSRDAARLSTGETVPDRHDDDVVVYKEFF
jgi:hypothetical protein